MSETLISSMRWPCVANEDISGTYDGVSITIEDDAIIVDAESNGDTLYPWTTLTVLRDGDEVELGYPSLQLPLMTSCCRICLMVNGEHRRSDVDTAGDALIGDEVLPAGSPICDPCSPVSRDGEQALFRRLREQGREAAADAERAERKDERSYEEWA